MNERVYWYAFLSAMFTRAPDDKMIGDLAKNDDILELFNSVEFFKDKALAKEALNIDFTTIFIVNSPPIESYIRSFRDNVPTGLDNEAVGFYRSHGYDFYLNKSELNAPDHLAIELGFLQALSLQPNSEKTQKEFLEERLLPWIAPYLIGVRSSLETPFYKNLCNITIDYLYEHYEELSK